MLDKYFEDNVKFVSYTGKWPCLCMGELKLKVDGKIYTWNIDNRLIDSGGTCSIKKLEKKEWIIHYKAIPDEIKKYATDIDRVINENIEWGCCGGCR